MDKILFVPHPKLRQQAKTIIKVTQSEIDLSRELYIFADCKIFLAPTEVVIAC